MCVGARPRTDGGTLEKHDTVCNKLRVFRKTNADAEKLVAGVWGQVLLGSGTSGKGMHVYSCIV